MLDSEHALRFPVFKIVYVALFYVMFWVCRGVDSADPYSMIPVSSLIAAAYFASYCFWRKFNQGSLAKTKWGLPLSTAFYACVSSASLFGFAVWAACLSRTEDTSFNDTAFVVIGNFLGPLHAFLILAHVDSCPPVSSVNSAEPPTPAPPPRDDSMLTSGI